MILANLVYYFNSNRLQILSFGLIGVITFILNFLLIWLFFGFIGLDYRFAVTLAYIITLIAHFGLNRTFTYKAKGPSLIAHIAKYSLLLIVNYLITLFVNIITVEILGLTPYYGVIFATGCVMFTSFLLMKYYVFSKKG